MDIDVTFLYYVCIIIFPLFSEDCEKKNEIFMFLWNKWNIFKKSI